MIHLHSFFGLLHFFFFGWGTLSTSPGSALTLLWLFIFLGRSRHNFSFNFLNSLISFLTGPSSPGLIDFVLIVHVFVFIWVSFLFNSSVRFLEYASVEEIDGLVDVWCFYFLGEPKFGMSSSQSNHSFKGPDCNWHGDLVLVVFLSFVSKSSIELSCILNTVLVYLRRFLTLRKGDVFL